MIYGLQKASLLKRVSAFILDTLLIITVAAAIIMGLLMLTGQDAYAHKYNTLRQEIVEEYKSSVGLTNEIAESLTDEQKAAHEKALEDFFMKSPKLPDVEFAFAMMLQLTLICVTSGLLVACLILDLAVPLIFKNGQTLGKKMFGLGVMKADGIKLSGFALFVRTVLGKFTIEIMVPVYIVIMILLGQLGIVGLAVLILLVALEIGTMVATKTNSNIHDLISATVVVDLPSQMIFDSPEAMLEYKKKLHAESVDSKPY